MSKKSIMEIDEIKTKKEPKFTKEQLIKSKMYRHQIDILKIVLEENKTIVYRKPINLLMTS